MRELTAHEVREQERLRADGLRNSTRVERQDLRRLVPVNMVLDSEHCVTLMRQGAHAHRPFLLWRHFAAVGMRADGYTREQIAEALELAPDKYDAVLAPLRTWDPPEDVKARFPLLYPRPQVETIAPVTTPERQREDFPFLNSDGYRVMGPLGPGMRTRTLAGNQPMSHE